MPGSDSLSGISSMATRALLAELTEAYQRKTGQAVAVESVGGVDAANRLKAGEAFDFVVLARNVMQELETAGKIVAGSLVDLARSPIALAVAAGAARPDISSEEAVKQAVARTRSIGFSTGPSGTHFQKLLVKWGIADAVKDRLVIPPPGTPVAQLLANGSVEIGFQQLSEFVNASGIQILGLVPDAIQQVTTFTAGIGNQARDSAAAKAFLAYLVSSEAVEAKQRQGLQP